MKWKTVMSFCLFTTIVLGMPTPEIEKPQTSTIQPQQQTVQVQQRAPQQQPVQVQQRVPQSSLNSVSNGVPNGEKVGIIQPRTQLQIQPQLQAQQQQLTQPQVTLNVQPQVQQPSLYSHLQPQNFQPSAGYFLAVNPNQSVALNGNQQATPIIMQYIPQQMNTGPLADQGTYLQYIPSRPLFMPYPQYVQPSQFIPSVQQPITNTINTSPSLLPTTISQPQYAVTQPQTFPNFNPIHASPLISTSMAPSSYFAPSSRIQIINPPTDLVLNTNEYIPQQHVQQQTQPQIETGFRAIKSRV